MNGESRPDLRQDFPSGSFLGGLSQDACRALLAISEPRSWAAGVTLLDEGASADKLIVLLRGVVKVMKTASTGQEVLLELRRGGDLIGEFGVVDGARRSASVVTQTPVVGMVAGASRFNELLRTNAAITHRLLVTVIARSREASERQLEMGTVDVLGRVCRRLVDLVLATGLDLDGRASVRGVSQEDIAKWVGVSRDGVVRSLAELRASGWISTGRQRIDVIDLQALSRRAAGS